MRVLLFEDVISLLTHSAEDELQTGSVNSVFRASCGLLRSLMKDPSVLRNRARWKELNTISSRIVDFR